MKFVYTFGYETPTEMRNNVQHGWDDESSCSLLIDAEDADRARDWGRCIAEEFLRRLFEDPEISWRAHQYADSVVPGEVTNRHDLPEVKEGELPDFKFLFAMAQL